MTAYYNERDAFKAQVIRLAIKAGALPAGEVDERSIADVAADDLRGFRQCHFFAGGGFWALALRLAGWPENREVWTGSCPCPSFSAAGQGRGFDDPRHLWPDWFRLIGERCPATVLGEQVAAAIGHGWLDLVHSDLESAGYAVASAVLGACSVGAPHIRQRLYFCAHAEQIGFGTGGSAEAGANEVSAVGCKGFGESSGLREAGDTAHAHGRFSGDGDLQRGGELGLFAEDCGSGIDAHAESDGWIEGRSEPEGQQRRHDDAERRGAVEREHSLGAGLEGHGGDVRAWRGPGWLDPIKARSIAETGATRGFWAGCDWWHGRDGKWRPIGSGIFPLAHGSAARMGRLRMYGDAIVVPLAQAFIEAVMEA